MKKSAKPKQNRIALLTLLFTLMVFMIFASTMLIMGLAGYIPDPKRNLDHRGKRQI